MGHNRLPTRMDAAFALVPATLWTVIMFYNWSPGAMSVDSLVILGQARGAPLSDAFPPLLALIWRVMDGYIPGPQLMLGTQLAIYSLAVSLTFLLITKHRSTNIFLFFVFSLWPPLIGIIGAIWADIYMAAFLFVVVFFASLMSRTSGLWKNLAFGGGVVFLFAAVSVRHNAAAAAVPVSGWFLFVAINDRFSPIKRLVVASVGGGALVIVLFLIANLATSVVVQTRAYFWTTTAQYDIAGIAVLTNGAVDISVLNPQTMKDIEVLYTPRSMIPLQVGRQVHEEEVGRPFKSAIPLPFNRFKEMESARNALAQTWTKVVISHPAEYLRHRSLVFQSLIGLPPYSLWGPVYTGITENSLGVPERPELFENGLFAHLYEMSHSIVFKPYIYLILSLLLLPTSLVLYLRHNSIRMAVSTFLFSSGILHMIGLFFTVGSADFRYSHWMIATTTMGSLVLFSIVWDKAVDILLGCKHGAKCDTQLLKSDNS